MPKLRNFAKWFMCAVVLSSPLAAKAGALAEVKCKLFEADITSEVKGKVEAKGRFVGNGLAADIVNKSRTYRITKLEVELAGSLDGFPFRKVYETNVGIDPEFIGVMYFETGLPYNATYDSRDRLKLDHWKIRKFLGCKWN